MKEFYKFLKLIAIVLVLYGTIGLFMQFIFSFFNQTPNQDSQLTFLNFVLPFFLTISFMVFGAILMFKKKNFQKSNLIISIIIIVSEVFSVKWQIQFLIWALTKKSISEVLPISIGIIMVIYVFIFLFKTDIKKIMSKGISQK